MDSEDARSVDLSKHKEQQIAAPAAEPRLRSVPDTRANSSDGSSSAASALNSSLAAFSRESSRAAFSRPRAALDPHPSTVDPSRNIQVVDFEEQQQLAASANQIALYNKSKRHWCRLCKCFIYRGINRNMETRTIHEHFASAKHKRNETLLFYDWQEGCQTCKKTKFNSQAQYIFHVRIKKHNNNIAKSIV